MAQQFHLSANEMQRPADPPTYGLVEYSMPPGGANELVVYHL
jgi:hypothetical protein